VADARGSLAAAGLLGAVEVRRAPLEGLAPGEIAGRVVLANVPLPAHRALLYAAAAPAAAARPAGGGARARGATPRPAPRPPRRWGRQYCRGSARGTSPPSGTRGRPAACAPTGRGRGAGSR